MSAAKGRSLLVYVADGATTTPDAVVTSFSDWKLIGGAQERSIEINNEVIDATVAPASLDDALWSASLDGVKNVSISVALRLVNEKAERLILNAAKAADSKLRLVMVIGKDDTPASAVASADDSFGTQIAGEFTISSFSVSGSLSDTLNCNVTFASRGTVNINFAA